MKLNVFVAATVAVLFAITLGGCDSGNDAAASSAPPNEVDAQINTYEKAANEYVRLAKKHTSGDVSVTVLLIDARHSLKDESAKVQQTAAKMTPQQTQRVAAISAKTGPYLPQ